MALDWTPLVNEVDANPTVDGSILALVNVYIKQVEDLKTQVVGLSGPEVQAKIQGLADQMKATREQSMLAVTNNTPAQVPPTPIPDTSGQAGVDQQQAAQRAAQRSNPGGLGGSPR